MSGKRSRTKGQVYERRVRKYLGQFFDVIDSNRSGYDGDDVRIVGIPWLSIEVKNQKDMKLAGWVDQAVAQKGDAEIAVVVHHRKGKGRTAHDYVTMRAGDFVELLQRTQTAQPDRSAFFVVE